MVNGGVDSILVSLQSEQKRRSQHRLRLRVGRLLTDLPSSSDSSRAGLARQQQRAPGTQ